MRTSYVLLVLFRFVTGYKIITKSMIHGPGDLWYEPVPLKTKEELTSIQPLTTQSELVVENSEHVPRSVVVTTLETPAQIEYDEEEDKGEGEEEEEDDEESDINDFSSPATENPTQSNEYLSTTETPTQAPSVNRTKLYPVGRLWERTTTDIWSVLSAAIGCIWSGVGMDCFTYKVVPMFKSLMGFQPFNRPVFLLPRQSRVDSDIEGRTRRRHSGLKFLKTVLLSVAGIKVVILPILAALALISGKALFVSILSGLLTAATAWSASKNADRRVQTDSPQTSYYM